MRSVHDESACAVLALQTLSNCQSRMLVHAAANTRNFETLDSIEFCKVSWETTVGSGEQEANTIPLPSSETAPA